MNAALAIGALTSMRQLEHARPPAFDETQPVEDCVISLGLVRTDPSSAVSRFVDERTGGRGFSHVYVDPCRTLEDRRVIIDYTVGKGVHWADAEKYVPRGIEFVELDEQTGRELWGCVRSRIGTPFRIPPMAMFAAPVTNCVGLVNACLPSELRRQLEALREGPCLSPNTLARFFLGDV